jgi:hypothetical protein
MAEIKSTIDLIMERTKDLSASREEREAWHRQEREKHIRGLVQRLLDYSLTLDDVKDELEREKKGGRAAEALGTSENRPGCACRPRFGQRAPIPDRPRTDGNARNAAAGNP